MDADLAELDEFMAQSNAKARRGRAISRSLLAAGLVVLAFVTLLFLSLPSRTGPPFELGWVEWIAPGMGILGVVGILVGVAWMWRILRPVPEPDIPTWRYRDR